MSVAGTRAQLICALRGFWYAALLALGACSSNHYLVDTPTIYLAHDSAYEADFLGAGDRVTRPVIYVFTDRAAHNTNNPEKMFGSGRSDALIFARATTLFSGVHTAQDLVAVSSSERRRKVETNITDIDAIAGLPPTPFALQRSEGRLEVVPSVIDSFTRASEAIQSTITAALADKNTNEILLYIHGYNTNFRDSVLNLLDIWHFAGRGSVPVSYSWPAAKGGLTGYFADSESGEFSIYHLKQALRILMQIPTLEKINIVAHSRGTVLITSAMRELAIEARAAGRDLHKTLKIHNLILAAPDMDFGVVKQRLVAERLETAYSTLTAYTNEDDAALSFSSFLGSQKRLGKVKPEDFTDADRKMLALDRSVSFIRVANLNNLIGHSYYRTDPRALSDIVRILQSDAGPGTSARPLIKQAPGFWLLPKTYP